jgi:hypothetical protein
MNASTYYLKIYQGQLSPFVHVQLWDVRIAYLNARASVSILCHLSLSLARSLFSGRVGTDARIIRLNGYPCAVCEGRQLHITLLLHYVTFSRGTTCFENYYANAHVRNVVSVYSEQAEW